MFILFEKRSNLYQLDLYQTTNFISMVTLILMQITNENNWC